MYNRNDNCLIVRLHVVLKFSIIPSTEPIKDPKNVIIP